MEGVLWAPGLTPAKNLASEPTDSIGVAGRSEAFSVYDIPSSCLADNLAKYLVSTAMGMMFIAEFTPVVASKFLPLYADEGIG